MDPDHPAADMKLIIKQIIAAKQFMEQKYSYRKGGVIDQVPRICKCRNQNVVSSESTLAC